MVADGRGILAADDSTPTIGKHLAAIAVASTVETCRAWRELLVTTPGSAATFPISCGVA